MSVNKGATSRHNPKGNQCERVDYGEKKHERDDNHDDVAATTMGTTTMSAVDHISQLPDSIVHGILTLLPPRDATRTSILSKAWHRMCSTNPSLAFHLTYLGNSKVKEEEDYWLDRVYRCVMRHLIRNPNVRVLNVSMTMTISFLSSDLVATSVARWVRVALVRNIEELNLQVVLRVLPTNLTSLYLSPNVLVSKSLRVLRLCGCTLKGNFNVTLPQLQKLSLERVTILDGKFLKNLALGCPRVTDLDVTACQGERSYHHPGLSFLQLKHLHLDMWSWFRSKSVEIKAPNLITFSFCGEGVFPNPCEISLPDSIGLHTLELHEAWIDDQAFQKLMTGLPGLEVLELHLCKMLRRIRISSQKLRKLVLRQCHNLLDIEIDAPNLLSVYHFDEFQMPFNFMITTSHHRLKVVDIEFCLDSTIDLVRLHRLKDFVLKSSHSEDFKLVVCLPNSRVMFIHEKLSEVLLSPIYHLKDLEPIVLITSKNYKDLVDHMLQSYQPETVSIIRHHGTLFEFLNANMKKKKKTMNGRESSPCWIKGDEPKIWQDYLDGFEIFNFEGALK